MYMISFADINLCVKRTRYNTKLRKKGKKDMRRVILKNGTDDGH